VRRLPHFVLLGSLLWASSAGAYPFFAPRPVPNAIAGAADPHVAAIFYNPAALGPLRGLHVYFEGSARFHVGSIDRTSDPTNENPSAPVDFTDFDSFAGLSWDLNTDSFTIGLAVYTPLVDISQFGDGPLRYHAISHQFYQFEQSAAAALRISSRFYIGAGANFSEDWIDYQLARDVALQGGSALVSQPNAQCGGMPCGFENPLARQVMHLRGFNWGIGFSVGFLARPTDRWWLALSYVSHIFNTGHGADFPLSDSQRPYVQPAPGQPEVCNVPNPTTGQPIPCNDLITIAIPDLIMLATRVEVTARFEFEGSARWIHYGDRSNVDVTFQGGTLALQKGNPAGSVPSQFFLDRGFRDTVAFEVSGRWKLGEKLRLSPSLLFETSAMPSELVNAAAIDAPKFDLALTAEWKPTAHLVLGAHVGTTAYILSDAGQRFDPTAQVACADAGGAIAACGATNVGGYNNGDALPTAAGRYTYFVVHAGAAIGMEF
jgi:long-subunit fatty acid transport protein